MTIHPDLIAPQCTGLATIEMTSTEAPLIWSTIGLDATSKRTDFLKPGQSLRPVLPIDRA